MLKHFDEIKNFLPHREPFLFIEEIVEVELGKSTMMISTRVIFQVILFFQAYY